MHMHASSLDSGFILATPSAWLPSWSFLGHSVESLSSLLGDGRSQAPCASRLAVLKPGGFLYMLSRYFQAVLLWEPLGCTCFFITLFEKWTSFSEQMGRISATSAQNQASRSSPPDPPICPLCPGSGIWPAARNPPSSRRGLG